MRLMRMVSPGRNKSPLWLPITPAPVTYSQCVHCFLPNELRPIHHGFTRYGKRVRPGFSHWTVKEGKKTLVQKSVACARLSPIGLQSSLNYYINFRKNLASQVNSENLNKPPDLVYHRKRSVAVSVSARDRFAPDGAGDETQIRTHVRCPG